LLLVEWDWKVQNKCSSSPRAQSVNTKLTSMLCSGWDTHLLNPEFEQQQNLRSSLALFHFGFTARDSTMPAKSTWWSHHPHVPAEASNQNQIDELLSLTCWKIDNLILNIFSCFLGIGAQNLLFASSRSRYALSFFILLLHFWLSLRPASLCRTFGDSTYLTISDYLIHSLLTAR